MSKKHVHILSLFLFMGMFIFPAKTTTAQVFGNNTGGAIPDNNTEVCFPVVVSGLQATINSSFGLKQCSFDITHTYDGDLKIKLKSPDGTVILLCGNHGGNGNNFNNTVLKEDATGGEIATAVAPFNGNYYPDESINILNNGQDPNGTWHLCIIDEVPQDAGTLNSFSITFGSDPPPTHIETVCSTTNASGCNCPGGATECDLLPDMTNSGFHIQNDHAEHNGHITLGTATPDIGYGPLEMRGIDQCYCDTVLVPCATTECPDGSDPKELVNQRIYHKNGATMTYYDTPAGTMTHHPEHSHIHVDDWVFNTLRIKGINPDPASWPMIGTGTKQSFCLINLGTCSGALGTCVDTAGNILGTNDVPNPNLGSVTGCGSMQGIYAGHYDVYNQSQNGLGIEFPPICNGLYYMVSTTDPQNAVKESIESNNSSVTPIILTLQQGNCCNANFYAGTQTGLAPLTVQFIDSTIPVPLTWKWDFGDGSSDTTQFPLHTYATPGTYSVKLIISTHPGCYDTLMRSNYIVVNLPPCEIPGDITTTNINSSSATIQWLPVSNASKYKVRIRISGTATWITYKATPPGTIKTVSDLYPNTLYEYQVQTLCSGAQTSSSPFSASYFFTTSNFCTEPAGLNVTDISVNSVMLQWNLAANTTKYQIRIRQTGTSSWSNYNKPGSQNSINISGLTAATNYEWQIRSKCGTTDYSNYSSLQNFTTLAVRSAPNNLQAMLPAIAVYPNPSTGNFTVELNDRAKGKSTLSITNVVGNEVFFFETENEFNSFYKEIDLSGLADGIYFLHISFSEVDYVTTIVKQ